MSHMSDFDALLASRRSFLKQLLKKAKCKVDWNLRFLNDLELCAYLVWVT